MVRLTRAAWHRWVVRAMTGVVAVAALVAPVATAPAAAAAGDALVTAPARTWGTNGRVRAILPVGDAIFVAGEFTAVLDPNGRSYPMPRVAKYLPASGTFDRSWTVAPDGPVYALAAVGDTLVLGGNFSKVGTKSRKSLAAVSISTHQLDEAWRGGADRQVDALATDGTWVYAGGPFTTVFDAGVARAQANLARFALSGTPDHGWIPAPDARVRSLLVRSDASGVYVGGDFGTVGGSPDSGRLVRVSTSTGTVDPTFRAGPTNQNVRAPALALVEGASGLLVGTAGSGGGCALLDSATGRTLWSHHGNGDVQAVAFLDGLAYCGGHFSGSASFSGLDREKLAAVDPATGAVTAYAPAINSALGLWAMAATPESLLLGGDFTRVSTVIQPSLAQVRLTRAWTAPAAPAGLGATPGNGSVALTWDVPSTDGGTQVQRYRVFRAPAGGSWVSIGTSNQESFADLTVVNGRAYAYAVSAVNAVGESDLSAPVSATPTASAVTAPGTPGDFRATGVYAAAQLAWSAPAVDGGSPITGYRVYRSQTSGAQVALVDLPADARSYSDTQVTVGTRYYYVVAAVNEVGAGSPTTEASAVPSSGVPAAPVLTAGPGSRELSWSVPASEGGSPVFRYVLIRDGIRVATTTADVRSFVDLTAPPGSRAYQVKAVNTQGSSRWSNAVTLVIPG